MRWRPAQAVQRARQRYTLLWRKRLEQQAAGGSGHGELVRRGVWAGAPVRRDEVVRHSCLCVGCPAADRWGVHLPPAPSPRQSDVGEQQLQQLEQELTLDDLLLCRATAERLSHVAGSRAAPWALRLAGAMLAGAAAWALFHDLWLRWSAWCQTA